MAAVIGSFAGNLGGNPCCVLCEAIAGHGDLSVYAQRWRCRWPVTKRERALEQLTAGFEVQFRTENKLFQDMVGRFRTCLHQIRFDIEFLAQRETVE